MSFKSIILGAANIVIGTFIVFLILLLVFHVKKTSIKTIHAGPGMDVSVIYGECKARNAGESVWIDCDVFFEGKRLTKTR